MCSQLPSGMQQSRVHHGLLHKQAHHQITMKSYLLSNKEKSSVDIRNLIKHSLKKSQERPILLEKDLTCLHFLLGKNVAAKEKIHHPPPKFLQVTTGQTHLKVE